MFERYSQSNILSNSNEMYSTLLAERNVNKINHHETQKLMFPTREQLAQLSTTPYVWKSNDKYWKLSDKYYGDPSYWWVISFFNKKPTEMELNIGDIIYIPQPLEKILYFIKG